MGRFNRSIYPDEPNVTLTTSCGAKVSIYWPRDRTEDDCKRNLERAAGVLAKSLYQDIKSGRRTVDEMVAQIREHIPDYEPQMIPREQALGG